MKGQILIQVRLLAKEQGGAVRASDLEAQGWTRKYAITYLTAMTRKGHFTRQEAGALPLKRGRWEPSYQLP